MRYSSFGDSSPVVRPVSTSAQPRVSILHNGAANEVPFPMEGCKHIPMTVASDPFSGVMCCEIFWVLPPPHFMRLAEVAHIICRTVSYYVGCAAALVR